VLKRFHRVPSDAFLQLSRFITDEMQMSHIYQPAMLMQLLEGGGAGAVRKIAERLLLYDISQIEYYERVTKNMVGKVLTKNRGVTERTQEGYSLKGFAELSSDEIEALIALCKEKIGDFLDQRGDAVFSHRRLSSGYVPGTMRYEILKRAKFRCELCGISADEKALEVDHILPRNRGGTDHASNFQALCFSCNATKRDRDDTDFRGVAASYQKREPGCVFCEIPADRIVAENELCFAIRDGFPVTQLHTLIIPKRHVADFFELYQPERNAVQALLETQRAKIMSIDPQVTAFNIGINAGADAGQTIFHCHIHIIPRRAGDVENPRGGVRGVIPEKQGY